MSKCKVIALANQKGGTGKTTTAGQLRYRASKRGKEGAACRRRSAGGFDNLFGVSGAEQSFSHALNADGKDYP